MQERPSRNRQGLGLEERFQASTPTTRYEYVDVFFETADTDVVVRHQLRPQYPDTVNYEVVQATAPTTIYHDGSVERREWTSDTVLLRSNVSNVRVRIRLSLPADENSERFSSVEYPGAPGDTYIPASVVVAGDVEATGEVSAPDGHFTDDLDVDDDLNVDGDAVIDGTQSLGGLLTLLAGQIAFPATQNPSAGANVLDDYEEGSWTPELQFGGATTGITYNTRSGVYIKVGRLVFFAGFLQLTNKGSATGNATIEGLPYDAPAIPSTPVGVHGGSTGLGALNPPMFILTGGTILVFSATSLGALNDTHYANDTFQYFSGVTFAAS